MSSSVLTHLLRVSGYLLAGIAFLALATAKGGAQTGAGAANPIDLSVTVQQGRSSKKIAKPADAKKTMSSIPAENVRKPKQTLAPDAKFAPARNAVGVSVAGSAGSPGTGPAINLSQRNAAGGGATTAASVAGTTLGPGARPSHLAPSTMSHQGLGTASAATTNPAVSGNVVRPGSGPAFVGGTAKNIAGVNGTTVRPKRCIGGC
jgi:hypothetical protein